METGTQNNGLMLDYEQGLSDSSIINRRAAFTLIEVMLVAVVIVIVSAVSIPHLASSFRGSKLRTTAQTISRMSRYARSMSIMREKPLTLVLNHETMEVYLGEYLEQTDTSDGELDQDVLKRLGYTDDDGGSSETGGVEKEIHKYLPDGLSVKLFDKELTEEDDQYENLYMIRFFPNGQCDWFELEIEDNRGISIHLENDSITGKVKSEFMQ